MEDYYEHRWPLLIGMTLFYGLAIFLLPKHSADYSNVSNIEKLVVDIHSVLFRWRHIISFFISVIISPWVLARQFNLEVSQNKSNDKNSNMLLSSYYVIVVIFGQIIVYNFFNPSIKVITNHPFMIGVIPLLLLTFLSSVVEYEDKMITAASGTLLTVIITLFLVFTRDFSITWAILTWLCMTPMILFLLITIIMMLWGIEKEVEIDSSFIGGVGLIASALVIGILVYWATKNENPIISWILAITAILAGILFLIIVLVGSRDMSNVQQFIDEHLLSPSLELPRIRLEQIERSYANTDWTIVNIIVDTFNIMATALINTIVKMGHFIINWIIVPGIEFTLKSLLWLLAQIYNILLFFFSHLVFIILFLPRFLRDVGVNLYKALERGLRFVYFPVIAFIAFVMAINVSLQFTINYFLIGKKLLLVGILGGGVVSILSIVCNLSLVFNVSFDKAFQFYFQKFSNLLAYLTLIVCGLCWFLVWFAPKFGIQHFKPGTVTWSSTIVIFLGIIIAIFQKFFSD